MGTKKIFELKMNNYVLRTKKIAAKKLGTTNWELKLGTNKWKLENKKKKIGTKKNCELKSVELCFKN